MRVPRCAGNASVRLAAKAKIIDLYMCIPRYLVGMYAKEQGRKRPTAFDYVSFCSPIMAQKKVQAFCCYTTTQASFLPSLSHINSLTQKFPAKLSWLATCFQQLNRISVIPSTIRSREKYQVLTSVAQAQVYGGTVGSEPLSMSMQYICGDYAVKMTLLKDDPIRCKECGGRALYKKRTKR
jgi:DNA-directed RNA polymerase I, II, and III subunit RPABC4